MTTAVGGLGLLTFFVNQKKEGFYNIGYALESAVAPVYTTLTQKMFQKFEKKCGYRAEKPENTVKLIKIIFRFFSFYTVS